MDGAAVDLAPRSKRQVAAVPRLACVPWARTTTSGLSECYDLPDFMQLFATRGPEIFRARKVSELPIDEPCEETWRPLGISAARDVDRRRAHLRACFPKSSRVMTPGAFAELDAALGRRGALTIPHDGRGPAAKNSFLT